MSEAPGANTTWLPNLVGGVSIWKLGIDLNEPKFMDGRLLVPETEGSESLPARVAWNLDGLVPMAEARQKWPGELTTAVAEFKAGLERVGKVFATPNSGFDKFKEAFTVPSLEADGGTHYYYGPEAKKLYVTNWGASPRSITGRADYVFGYEDWGRAFGGAAALATGATVAGAPAAAPAANASTPPNADKKEEEKKKPEGKARPWWIWPLFALVAIALVLLALLLLRTCDDSTSAGPDASDVLVEGATDAARLGPDGAPLEDAGGIDPRADASADAGDASLDAAASDAGDGGAKDGGRDGGAKDGGKDGSADDDDDDDDGEGGSSGGAGTGTGTGKVVVTTGPGGGTKTSVHRRHYQGEAVKWRVSTGGDRVSRTEQRGHRYDVWLTPGKTFEGVRVEWQDKAGKWHPH